MSECEDDEATDAELLEMFPDNGTWLRRVRRWNIQHWYVVTYSIWAAIVGVVFWAMCS